MPATTINDFSDWVKDKRILKEQETKNLERARNRLQLAGRRGTFNSSTSAFEFCSAHDDDSVTERDDTTLTAIAVCDSRINIWDTSSYTTTKLDETNNERDETTLTAIAVCDPTINICLDKNDSTEFGTEEFKQREDSSLTKVVVHSDEDIKTGDTSSYTTTKLDETNNNEGDDTTLTAIAVCDSSINICLDKNDPTEFGTEEFKQSDILSDTSTELDKGTNNEGDDTALTAIAVCDPSINICLDKNDPAEFGTEEFKQRSDIDI
ncbi:uncharacterized protein RHO17_005485 [Thomomys bottae]